MFLRACAAGAAILLAAGPAAAEATSEGGGRKLRVVYEAGAECPDAASFRADLLARTARIALSNDADAEPWTVRIGPSAEGFEGSLLAVYAEAGAEPSVQRGRTCAAVASALALTLALIVDPSSRTDASAGPTTRPEPVRKGTAPPGASSPAVPSASGSRRVFAAALGVDLLAAAFSPALGGLVAGVESRPSPAAAIPVLLRGRLMLARQGKPDAGAEARVGLGALGLDACVFALGRRAFVLRPCIGIEPGVAAAEGRGVSSPSKGTALWVSVSARLRLEIALARSFGLALEGGALATLVRPRFVIDPPRRTAAEARAVGTETSLSAWVLFP